MHRVLALALVLACGHPAAARGPAPVPARPVARVVASGPAVPAPDVAPPPGPRLPATVAPLAYDLRLEVDPDRDTFRGTVEIRATLTAATRVVWLHAVELDITEASYRAGGTAGPLTRVPGAGPAGQLAGFVLAAPAGPGEIVLRFVYTGSTRGDQVGLFRQRLGGHTYLYAQSQSAFARRILPCFDEPRFKVPWRVTLVVPGDLVALGNAPTLREARLPDGRREVVLREIGPLPSYLLAIAVGPFALVDGGVVGRARVPLRVAVWPAGAPRAASAIARVATLVDAAERYLDAPLPWPKLDLVAVPEFFGAMENVGLITFAQAMLIGEPGDAAFLGRMTRVAAHEIAHQWFGNAVTPAWWDDLWLSEAFASFIGDKLAAAHGGMDDVVLRAHEARAEALAADARPGPRSLRRAITESTSIDDLFDEQAYEKGGAVLAMFEAFLGEARFADLLRAVVRAHAGGGFTTPMLLAAVERASSPAVAAALASYVDHPGAPIVELAVRCDGPRPVVIAHARARAVVPLCVRVAGAATPVCGVIADHTPVPLPVGGCPAWVVGNAGGRGYYQLALTTAAAVPPVLALTPSERLTTGSDLASAVGRGELALPDALALVRRFAAAGEVHAQLAAVALARAVDPLIGEADRPRWARWLVRAFRARLAAAPRTPAEGALVDVLVTLVPPAAIDPRTVGRARRLVDRALAGRDVPAVALAVALVVVAGRGDAALLGRVLAAGGDARLGDATLAFGDALGWFPPALAPRLVALLRTRPEAAAQLAAGLGTMLGRPEARAAAWRALRPHLAAVLGGLAVADGAALIHALGDQCERSARAEIARVGGAAVPPGAPARRALDEALARIDACLAQRAAAGPLAF